MCQVSVSTHNLEQINHFNGETWTEHCTWMQKCCCTHWFVVNVTTKFLWSCFYVVSCFCFNHAIYFMLRPQHNYFLNIHTLSHTKTCITYSHLCTYFLYWSWYSIHTVNTSKWIWYFFCWLLLHLLLLFLYMCGFFCCIYNQTHTQWLMLSFFPLFLSHSLVG